jgi:hypothetical protein
VECKVNFVRESEVVRVIVRAAEDLEYLMT